MKKEELRVGMKLEVKKDVYGLYGCLYKNEICEICEISDIAILVKVIKTDKIFMNNRSTLIIIDDAIDNVGLIEEERKQKQNKTNRILYTSSSKQETIIEYEIEGKDLNFSVEKNNISFRSLLKILLKETDILSFKYNRVSPYKITENENIEANTKEYNIDFIDVRDEFKVKTQTIVQINKNRNKILLGEYKIFVPDLLELCRYLRMVALENGRYIVKIDLDSHRLNGLKYLHKKPTVKELEQQGFIVPELYKNI